MTRALTAPELSLIRTEGQRSQIFMGILTPSTIFACRVNQTFSSLDNVAQVIYDGVTTGAFADVLPGMTLYIGSSAGAYDLGMLRIRASATSTILYFNETSSIAWADDLYLTVVDEFGLWAKHLRIEKVDAVDVVYMDYDVAYSDQHADQDPVPVLGPIASALWLAAGTVDYTPDASSSWVHGSTISAYAWATTGGSVVDETTATPTFTYTAAGTYRINCLVTAANGKSYTGYRYIFVYDDDNMPVTEFNLRSCTGSGNGWSFSVDMTGEADTIRERSLVVLFSKDLYGSTEQSIGAAAGNENILAVGWIDEETITIRPEQGTVGFRIYGPSHWIAKIPGYPIGFLNTSATPTAWTELEDLTVDQAAWALLHWRSTATAIMDITLTDDSRLAASLEAPTTSLLSQLGVIASESILAGPKVDRYGHLYLEIDSQYIAEADRSGIPIVMAITSDDWRNNIAITRKPTGSTALVDLSGVAYDGTTGSPLFSKAYGTVFSRYGNATTKDRLLLDDQAQANLLAGLVLSYDNNEYPIVRIPLSSNMRMADIAPLQYITLSLAAADNERGLIWTDKKLIPRRVSISYDANTGMMLTDLECEAEVLELQSVAYLRPQTPQDNIPPLPDLTVPDWALTPFSLLYESPETHIPQEIPLDPDDDCPADLSSAANGPWDLVMQGILEAIDRPASKYSYLWAIARIGTATNKTSYLINADFQERISGGSWGESTDADWYTVYPITGEGVRLTAGTKDAISSQDQRSGYFNMPAAAQFRSIEFNIDEETISGQTFQASTQPVGPPVLAWTYLGVSEQSIIPFEGGYKLTGVSSFTCDTLTPVSGSAGGTCRTDVIANSFPISSYIDVSVRMSVLAAPVQYSGVTMHIHASGTSTDDTVETLTYYNPDFSFSPSSVAINCDMFFAYPDGVVAVGLYQFGYTVIIKPSATKRVILNSMSIFNVCPRPSTG